MGYYASGEGGVFVKPENDIDEVYRILEDYMLVDSIEASDPPRFIGLLWEYSKYYDDSVIEALDLIADKISSGELRFVGDDGYQWKFVFEDGKWIEKDGEVLFDSERVWVVTKNGKFVAAFKSYDNADYFAECSDMEVDERTLWF